MASFGPTLQRERQRRGISIDEIAHTTRVARRYLVALEDEAIRSLPGGPYNRAYLRTYATCLGLDPGGLVRDYDATVNAQAEAGQLRPVAPDARTTMRMAAERRAAQRTRRTIWSPATIRVAALSGVTVAVLVTALWAGVPLLTQRVEVEPREPDTAPDLVASTGGRTGVDVSRSIEEPSSGAEPLRQPVPEAVSSEKAVAPAIEVERRDASQVARLSIASSGVGTAVVDRELVGQSNTFPVGAGVVFWTLVTGGHAGDTVRHVWIHEGRVVASVALRVGSPHWRTYSRRSLDPGSEGEWIVEARDARGRVLVRHAFRCRP
jgi:cytoskeletal protein RodZ